MKIKYLSISDIHLGHRNTPTLHIIMNMKRELFTDANKDLDIIFIVGDLFDRLLDFNSPEVHDILIFIPQLLMFCATNNIKLRVLEGTHSHDWQQSAVLNKINSTLKEPCDLKYHTTLVIEHMVDFGIHILYVPDEWTAKEEELVRDINVQLQEHGIKQVDIAMMHGHFKYQALHIPTTAIKFDEAYFLNLVKYYINIGHIHPHSHYERIVAQGSFDRLVHGEEHPKGYTISTIDTVTNERSWAFHINKNAYTYKTIKVTSSIDINKLDKMMAKLPKDCFVRLAMKKDHPLNANFDQLKMRYMDCTLKRQILDNSGTTTVAYIEDDDSIDMSQFTLNEANLADRLSDLIVSKGHPFNKDNWEMFHMYLKKETKNAVIEDSVFKPMEMEAA